MDHARPCTESEPPAKRQKITSTTRRPPPSQESDFSGVVWHRVDSDTRARTPSVLPPLRSIQQLFPRHSIISPRMLRFDAFLEAFGLAPPDVRGFVAQHPMGRCFCAFDSETTFTAFLDGINPWLNVLPHDDHGSVVVTLDHPVSIGNGAPIPRPPSPAAPADDTVPEELASRWKSACKLVGHDAQDSSPVSIPRVFTASLTPPSLARIYDLLHRTRRSRGASTSELTLVEALGAMGLLAQCWLSRDEDPRATLSGHQARRFLKDDGDPLPRGLSVVLTRGQDNADACTRTFHHVFTHEQAHVPTLMWFQRSRLCGAVSSSAKALSLPSLFPDVRLCDRPEAGTFKENQAMSLREFQDKASTLDMTAPSQWNITPDGVVLLIDISQVTAQDIRSTFSSPTTIRTQDPSTTTTITLHTRIRASIVYLYKIGRSDLPPEMAALVEEIQY
ncbi:hypothetical protein S7711_09664 [Stachybotrys chartarum IBT 7711]|uniref:Uncharacterized protein n=1 Tax=Stachybotrys chartarum (strain CBS 109288 / IBT 7711) TaxID=1280523 RepID=A0A084B7T6_STACB|nr:hypothetical protein S7711_09664 [Stachybotrys chartarum IBT 7711]